MICDLSNKTCVPCEGKVPALTSEQVKTYLQQLQDWKSNTACTEIFKNFTFKNYYHVMAFVNAIAFSAHQEKHHPDLEVHYNQVTVRYSTHAIGGLSENDFICAAKVDQLGVTSR
ncbi:MAG: 4a-hydroxytetrahydrobiopterin dehydratase [Gammaproteobacteria bacterium]|nr:4a-hydroxytetrahydrobiopterin dehydratase [Gammaproteobacteria bacterium]